VSGEIPPKDAQELACCFTEHAKSLFRYAIFITRGDKALAEDLVEDAFMAAAADWDTLRCRTEAQRYAWLRTVLRNTAVSIFRRNELARRKQPLLEERYRPAVADTHQDALSAIALERCWRAIKHLTERQHLVVSMYLGDGMKASEIAPLLGITVATVHVHLHDARKRLRAELGQFYPFADDAQEGGEGS
jgi:RNA polymerase sigma-70 factor (ECF subfamily)